ncbi:MAG: response regulator [Chitinophagaceae bacterium]|nr:response regulator [Chitinophagaceae bacterium]
MIIDDETDICYLLGAILRQRNIHSVFARNLGEAEKLILSSTSFCIIFLDNHLPDGLGTGLVEKIRKYQPATNLIMITAHDTSADRKMAERIGIESFIGKPFTRDTILRTIEKMY